MEVSFHAQRNMYAAFDSHSAIAHTKYIGKSSSDPVGMICGVLCTNLLMR